MVEAVRVAAVGPDVIVAFQLWDMDDFDVESTLLFRTGDFREAERVATVDGRWVDMRAFGDELYALKGKKIHVYRAGSYDAPSATLAVPVPGAAAFDGAARALWVVGKGAARYDGKKWTSQALDKDDELTAVHAIGESACAVGKGGLLVALGAQAPRKLPSPTTSAFRGIHAQPQGVLSLAGEAAWHGPAEALVALSAPDGVDDFNDVCEFRGQRYWSAAGANGGGVFVQEGDRLVQVLDSRCWHLSSTDEFLYAAGEREVFRFDGAQWLQLQIVYDLPTKRWALKLYDASAPRDEAFDEVLVVGSYAVSKPGALERALAKFFAQRDDNVHLKRWKAPKGYPAALVGQASDATYVIEDQHCTFTVPLLVKDIEPLRAYLEAGNATEIELRRGAADDVAANQARVDDAASKRTKKAARKGPKIVLEQQGAAVAREPQTVSMLFEYTADTEPSYDLTVVGEEVIGFGSHRKRKGGAAAGPQLHVLRALSHRTVANLALPTARPQGISRDASGALWAGSEEGTLYVSRDQGRLWEEEPAPGLHALWQGASITSTCWLEGDLWVGSSLGVARRRGDTWSLVALPESVQLPGTYEALKLVVSAGVLYVLAVGLARWNGSELVTEIGVEQLPERMRGNIPPGTLHSLTTTAKGTLLAGTTQVFRKPAGQAWRPLEPAALGIDLEKPFKEAMYANLVTVGGTIVLTGNIQAAHEQIHAIRISLDDGASFRPLRIDGHGKVIPTSAVADPEGGVLVAGFGGALLRVTL